MDGNILRDVVVDKSDGHTERDTARLSGATDRDYSIRFVRLGPTGQVPETWFTATAPVLLVAEYVVPASAPPSASANIARAVKVRMVCGFGAAGAGESEFLQVSHVFFCVFALGKPNSLCNCPYGFYKQKARRLRKDGNSVATHSRLKKSFGS
ncbi:hypothetical protein N9L76_04095 [bacterium]|nr:hypothetical protein [bacterium]